MDKDILLRAQLENIVTVVVAGAVVLGLAAIFKSWHCLWGLTILININTIKSRQAK